MIKALFFDIDGTLVSFRDHAVPVSTRRALEQLRQRGVKLFIASGRHPSDIFPVCDFPFDGYVALIGGYCLAGRDEVVFRQAIPEEDVERLIRWQQGPDAFACVLAGEREMCLNFVDERVERIRELVRTSQPARLVSAEEWSEAARDRIASMGYDPLYGARPVKRTIQRYVVNDLSKRILAGEVDRSKPIRIDAANDALTFEN